MFLVVIAVFTLYPKYTSVNLCIRVNIMFFIEQQQFCICIFVQYDFIYVTERLIFLLVLLVRPLVSLSKFNLYRRKYFQIIFHLYF